MAWSSPVTFTAGNILTAAQLNVNLRDNLNYLKGVAGEIAFQSGGNFTREDGSYQLQMTRTTTNPRVYGFAVESAAGHFILDDVTTGQRLMKISSTGGHDRYLNNSIVETLTTDKLKFPLTRQGGSSTNWNTTGTTTYLETGVFMQAGFSATSSEPGSAVLHIVNLPVPLSGASQGYGFAIPSGNYHVTVEASISGTTALLVTLQNADTGLSSSVAAGAPVPFQWFVIGK